MRGFLRKMKSEDIRTTMRDIGRDLLNIEVNTIEKANLTARKMPTLPHALLDIAETYRGMLTEKLDLSAFWDFPGPSRPEWKPVFRREGDSDDAKQLKLTTGADTFDKLRWAAARALWADDPYRQNKPHFDDTDRVVLYRIRRNCDQLKNIIYDLRNPGETKAENPWKAWLNEKTRLELLSEEMRYSPMGQMPVDYAVVVRKIWEMGVETVLMQTIVQIDGDVLTRIQTGMAPDRQERLLEAHRRGIEVSLSHWRTMFDVVKQFVGNLADLFLRRPS